MKSIPIPSNFWKRESKYTTTEKLDDIWNASFVKENSIVPEFEPDRVEWMEGKYGLLIVRGNLGQLNGYVGVPKKHSCFYENVDCINVAIHGGLTFSALGDERISHKSNKDLWYFGFDCAHLDIDKVPAMCNTILSSLDIFANCEYRDILYVHAEVLKLYSELRNKE